MNALEEILAHPFEDALDLFGYPMTCPEVPHHVAGTYFRYWPDKNIARCHGATCSRGSWNIVDLIMFYEDLGFAQAVKFASDKLGLICDFKPRPVSIKREPEMTIQLKSPAKYRQFMFKLEKTPEPSSDWRDDRLRYAGMLYFPEENMLIANKFYDNKERAVPVETALITYNAVELAEVNLDDNERGAWVCINPVSGEKKLVEKHTDNTHKFYSKTCKSSNDLSRYSYLLIESDIMTVDEQYSWLKNSRLPILTLTHSGGKSLHAVVLIDAPNEEEYKGLAVKVYEILQNAGFAEDQGNLNPNRYTRLPGVKRGDKPQYLIDTSQWQKFLSINDWIRWMTLEEEKVQEIKFDAQRLWEHAALADSVFSELEMDHSIREFNKDKVAPFVDLASGETRGCCISNSHGKVSVLGDETYYPCLYAGLNSTVLVICKSIKQACEMSEIYDEAVYYWAYEPECLEIWPVLKSAFERIIICTGGDQDYINAGKYFKLLNEGNNVEVIINE